jgi:hypothetical protein
MPTVSQLIQQIDRGLPVPVDLYLETFFYENMNQNFGLCSICRCRTWEQHQPGCDHSSIMTLPEWVAVYRERERDFEPVGFDE